MPIYKIDAQESPSPTGLTDSATGVKVDPAAIRADGYSALIGNGSSTSIVVTHNLGTRDVSVGVREAASPYKFITVDVERTSTNTITVKFASAPASNAYRVIIQPAL